MVQMIYTQNYCYSRQNTTKISAERAAGSLLRLKQSFYNQGEKPGKLLAWQIKQLQSESDQCN